MGFVAEPAAPMLRLPGKILGAGPFLQGHGNMGRKGSPELAPGHSHQHAVHGERRHLRIGRDLRKAVGQVIAQQAVRAVVGLNVLQGLVIHTRAHGIAHSHAQHTALDGRQLFFHITPSFPKIGGFLLLLYRTVGKKQVYSTVSAVQKPPSAPIRAMRQRPSAALTTAPQHPQTYSHRILDRPAGMPPAGKRP